MSYTPPEIMSREELIDEIVKLRFQVSNQNLYNIFNNSFEVNRYNGGWIGEWPELHYYIHEIWKRDPKVSKLESDKNILRIALKIILSRWKGEGGNIKWIGDIAEEALEQTKE
jgi:hypothetical protein